MPKSKPPRKKTSPGVYTKPSKNSIMKDLRELDNACEEMLSATAEFAPYLVNRDLVEAGDVEKIENNAKILTRDTVQLKTDLTSIRREVPTKLNPEKTDDVMLGLSIGEKYNSWQENYQRAVLPTVLRLSELFKAAAVRLKEKKESTDE
jgi:hypothetical protein